MAAGGPALCGGGLESELCCVPSLRPPPHVRLLRALFPPTLALAPPEEAARTTAADAAKLVRLAQTRAFTLPPLGEELRGRVARLLRWHAPHERNHLLVALVTLRELVTGCGAEGGFELCVHAALTAVLGAVAREAAASTAAGDSGVEDGWRGSRWLCRGSVHHPSAERQLPEPVLEAAAQLVEAYVAAKGVLVDQARLAALAVPLLTLLRHGETAPAPLPPAAPLPPRPPGPDSSPPPPHAATSSKRAAVRAHEATRAVQLAGSRALQRLLVAASPSTLLQVVGVAVPVLLTLLLRLGATSDGGFCHPALTALQPPLTAAGGLPSHRPPRSRLLLSAARRARAASEGFSVAGAGGTGSGSTAHPQPPLPPPPSPRRIADAGVAVEVDVCLATLSSAVNPATAGDLYAPFLAFFDARGWRPTELAVHALSLLEGTAVPPPSPAAAATAAAAGYGGRSTATGGGLSLAAAAALPYNSSSIAASTSARLRLRSPFDLSPVSAGFDAGGSGTIVGGTTHSHPASASALFSPGGTGGGRALTRLSSFQVPAGGRRPGLGAGGGTGAMGARHAHTVPPAAVVVAQHMAIDFAAAAVAASYAALASVVTAALGGATDGGGEAGSGQPKSPSHTDLQLLPPVPDATALSHEMTSSDGAPLSFSAYSGACSLPPRPAREEWLARAAQDFGSTAAVPPPPPLTPAGARDFHGVRAGMLSVADRLLLGLQATPAVAQSFLPSLAEAALAVLTEPRGHASVSEPEAVSGSLADVQQRSEALLAHVTAATDSVPLAAELLELVADCVAEHFLATAPLLTHLPQLLARLPPADVDGVVAGRRSRTSVLLRPGGGSLSGSHTGRLVQAALAGASSSSSRADLLPSRAGDAEALPAATVQAESRLAAARHTAAATTERLLRAALASAARYRAITATSGGCAPPLDADCVAKLTLPLLDAAGTGGALLAACTLHHALCAGVEGSVDVDGPAGMAASVTAAVAAACGLSADASAQLGRSLSPPGHAASPTASVVSLTAPTGGLYPSPPPNESALPPPLLRQLAAVICNAARTSADSDGSAHLQLPLPPLLARLSADLLRLAPLDGAWALVPGALQLQRDAGPSALTQSILASAVAALTLAGGTAWYVPFEGSDAAPSTAAAVLPEDAATLARELALSPLLVSAVADRASASTEHVAGALLATVQARETTEGGGASLPARLLPRPPSALLPELARGVRGTAAELAGSVGELLAGLSAPPAPFDAGAAVRELLGVTASVAAPPAAVHYGAGDQHLPRAPAVVSPASSVATHLNGGVLLLSSPPPYAAAALKGGAPPEHSDNDGGGKQVGGAHWRGFRYDPALLLGGGSSPSPPAAVAASPLRDADSAWAALAQLESLAAAAVASDGSGAL